MKEEMKPSLTLKCNDKIITYQFDYTDPDINDYLQAFATLMIGATFYPETVYNGMKTYAEEMLPEETESIYDTETPRWVKKPIENEN